MIIKLSDMIANLFIELDDNNLPMIIDLHQLYKIAGIVSKKEDFNVDFSGASLFELRFNSDKYFNYIDEAKTIVPSTSICPEDLKARFRNNVPTKLYDIYQDIEIKRILGIDFVSTKILYKPKDKPKIMEKKMLNYFAMTK